MNTPLNKKSTVEEIKARFDQDVERFSNLETAQQAVIDAPIMLELISKLAVSVKTDGNHLESIGGTDFRDKVFEYIEIEDSPRSLPYQMELMKKVGFKTVDILHKNCCFAAFVGIK
jgi:hypothetical protein